MKVKEFVTAYKEKRFMNTKHGVDERAEWIKNELEIKTYIPFNEKRRLAEMIVENNMSVTDGIKKYDDISSYVSLIVASIAAHTALEFGDDPVEDYDMLAESGLLTQIISLFQGSHEEIGILLKMAVATELEDNNTSMIIGRFLDGILKKLEKLDLTKLFDTKIKEEDLTKLNGFLNKLK